LESIISKVRSSRKVATYRLDIEYVGTDWHGWQIQPEHPTVQGALETALRTALRQPVNIVGSGRTDSGVHASGQVAHVAIEGEIDSNRVLGSLRGLLPRSIAVRSIRSVQDGFHARFDARSRQYRYRLGTIPFAIDQSIRWYLRPAPDMDRMNEAAALLLGTHDFDSFCRTQSETENRVCTVEVASWGLVPDQEGKIDFVIRADRFLHGMVRAIVGTSVEIGQGKRDVADITAILAARDRTYAGPAAPAHGLMLERVVYPDNSQPESNHPA
jgi:tRNA pseudouridine38-40 synthase